MHNIARTLSQMDSTLSTVQSQQRSEGLERLKTGRDAAKAILSRYPDYGKAPPEYLASIADLLSSFPDAMLKSLCDKHIGIAARCKYLPTHADFVEYADNWQERQHNLSRDPRAGRIPEPVRHIKFEPFPKMYAAFKDSPQLLHRTFDCLADAAKAFHREGKEAAAEILKRGHSIT
jgi:hypothetical protein